MEAYHAQNWRDAAGRFGELLASFLKTANPNLPAARPGIYRKAPEADWDGVYVMKSK